jgi:hypothetical protein
MAAVVEDARGDNKVLPGHRSSPCYHMDPRWRYQPRWVVGSLEIDIPVAMRATVFT